MNTSVSIVVTDAGIVTEVSFKQFWNVYAPMNVTELGIVIEARFSHEWNEDCSIRLNSVFVGNVTEFSLIQP